jgi:hypothetical protein
MEGQKTASCGRDTSHNVGSGRKFLSAVMYAKNITFTIFEASDRGILAHHVS